MIETLEQERERLVKHLNWLGVRSTGSERIERRIAELDRILKGREGSACD